MDEARNFYDTDSYGRDDFPLVAKLADQAHTFIFERLAELKPSRASKFASTGGRIPAAFVSEVGSRSR